MLNSMTNVFHLVVSVCIAAVVGSANAEVDKRVLEAEQHRVGVLKNITPSVVCIFSRAGDNGGSGVLISKQGEALTNFHVIAGLGPFVKCGLADGTINWAVVIGADPTGDLALIRLLGPSGEFRDDFVPATFGDSDEVKPGDTAIVIGNPFLLATNLQPTVTYGVVSGVGRYQYPSGTFLEYTECIQTDASINPGNSGGPMFDAAGKLIGINGRASFEKRGRVFTGAGYAISINQAKLFLDHLRSGRIVDHGTLSATVRTDQASGRVYAQRVAPNSRVAAAGMEPGHELVRFGGRAITSANDFKNRLGIYPAYWRVPMTFRDDDLLRKVSVRLEPLHTRAELVEQFKTQPFTPPRPDEEETPKAATTASDIVPESYQTLYESEPGFVNRAANRTQLERIRTALTAAVDLPADFTLRITGTAGGSVPMRMVSGTDGTAFQIEEQVSAIWKPGADPDSVSNELGAFLVLIDHMRHFLSDPEQFFTDYFYIGSEPDVQNQRRDIIETRRGETLARWYLSRDSGDLVAAELRLDPQHPWWSVEFGPTADLGPLTFPSGLTAQAENENRLSLQFADVRIATPQQ